MKKFWGWFPLVLATAFYVVMGVVVPDRLMLFAPSLGIIALIGLVAYLYVRYAIKRWFPAEKLGSVTWVNENKKMIAWRLSAPMLYVLAPTTEELFFRGPLLLLFTSLASPAWIGILVSALFFAVMHWCGAKTDVSELKTHAKSDDISEAAKEIERRHPKETLARRAISVLATLILGVMAGYYTIIYQSLWAGIAVHFIWNLAVPVLLPLLVILITVVIAIIARAVASIYRCVCNRNARREILDSIKQLARFRTSISYPVYRPELDEGVPLSEDDADDDENSEEDTLPVAPKSEKKG